MVRQNSGGAGAVGGVRDSVISAVYAFRDTLIWAEEEEFVQSSQVMPQHLYVQCIINIVALGEPLAVKLVQTPLLVFLWVLIRVWNVCVCRDSLW